MIDIEESNFKDIALNFIKNFVLESKIELDEIKILEIEQIE